MAEIKEFQGGFKAQREHLNELVRALNDAVKRIVELEAVKKNPLTIKVSNTDGTKNLAVLVDGLILKAEDAEPELPLVEFDYIVNSQRVVYAHPSKFIEISDDE